MADTIQSSRVVLRAAAVGTRSRAGRRIRQSLAIYLLLAPTLVIIATFSFVPLVWDILLSLSSGGMLGGTQFAGLLNYARALRDPLFLLTLRNTVEYAVLTVPTAIVCGLLVALMISQIPRARGLFRGTIYFPLVVPIVVAANVWSYIVNRDFGPLNFALGLVGLPHVDWLGNATLAIPSIMLEEVWRGFGFYVIVLSAALLALPREVVEAARIDGASGPRIAWSVTIPLLRPALGFCVVMATIWNFQIFDVVYVLTQGGPAGATATVSWYVYEQAFQANNPGIASTMSIFLLIAIVVLALGQLRYFRSDVEY
jgi:ABC-type sugar transport system permease subunit